MKKVRNLSFYGILGVLVAVLLLISISVTQAQVSIQAPGGQKGKPDKPPKDPPEPEATWAVSIPLVEGTMLYGDASMYENNDNDVRIKVEKGASRVRVEGGGRRTVFFYYFSFKLLRPTGRHAGFQNVVLSETAYPEVGPSCIFPDGACMQDFLNQDQPHSDYEYFNLKFQVGQYSFEQASVFSEGIEDMPYNVPVKFLGYSDWIKVRVQNQEDYSDPYQYHNVECDERNSDDGDYDNMNIWIERLELNKWRISVVGADLLLQEQYTQSVAGKGKKTTTETVVPLDATGSFTFYVDFIRIPIS